ncbi:MAG TPA: biotin/lipoyl-containing protein, partial [Pseudolabrys sp.]
DSADAFQLAGARKLTLPVLAEGETIVAQVTYGPSGATVAIDGIAPATDAVAVAAAEAVYVLRHGRQTKVSLRDLTLDEAGDHGAGGLVRAPMHGKVLSLLVERGARVTRGQRLAIIEAMKMEHTLTAPIDGTVTEIAVAADTQVAEDAKVMVITPQE